MRSQTRGLLLVLIASVCLSTVPTAIKVGLGPVAGPGAPNPLQLLAPRMALGALLLWIWVGVTRPHRLRIDRQGRWDAAVAGGINAVSLSLFYLALRRIDASVAILIFSVYPAVLLLLLRLRGEAVTRLDMLRLTLALAGIWLVARPGGTADVVGILLAFGCAAIYSLYVLVVHTRLVSYPSSTSAVWVVTFMAICVNVLRLFEGPGPALGVSGWGAILWSAVFGTAVARMMTIEGIRLLGGGQAALLMPVETVMTVSWASLLLGERLAPAQLVGAVLVIASVLLATARSRVRRNA